MVFVTFHYAYWQHKHPNGDRFDLRYDTEHMMVRIFRFTGIPTQAMIDNNETSWHVEEWRNGTFGKAEFYLRDNDLPVRARARALPRAREAQHAPSPQVNFASLVASFFAISAVFHLCASLRLTGTQTITLTAPSCDWQGLASWESLSNAGFGTGGNLMTALPTGAGLNASYTT